MGFQSPGGGGGAADGGVGVSLATAGNTAGTMAALSAGTLSLYGGNGITLSQNGSSIVSIVGNSAAGTNLKAFYDGANSASSGTISLANANGVTFTLNANTLSASINTMALASVSRYWANSGGQINSQPHSNASEWVFPLNLETPVSFTRWDFPMSVSAASAATNATAALDYTVWLRVMTRSNSTLTPITGMSTQGTITWASNSSGWSNLTANLLFPVPFAGTLAPNQYFAALSMSTHTGSSIGLSTTALGFSMSFMVSTVGGNASLAFQNLGDNGTNASMNEMYGFQGGNSVAITNSTQQTIQQSNMTMTGGPLRMHLIPILRAT